MGERVTFRGNGHVVHGYLARPGAGRGPGIVVIQEWWGLPQIERVCDRLASEGYLAVAPDLFHGTTASYTEPDAAAKLLRELDIGRAVKDMSGAVEFLRAHESHDGGGLGSIGFCMGGSLSLVLATTRREVSACVTFYGIPERADYANLQGAVLGHFAEHDDWASPDAVRKLDQELTRAGKRHEFHTYAGTTHAFFNEDRPEAYNAAAADLAWTRTLGFLHRELR